MSFLLSESEFREARAAIGRGDITPALYGFLHRLVAAHVRQRFVARAVSPGGRVDNEAVQELVHEWLAERLLAGGLRSAFDAVASPKGLARYLETSLGNHLATKARERGGPRLLVRARRILEADPGSYQLFRRHDSWLRTEWGLSGWRPDTPPFGASDDELVRAAYSLGEFAIVRYSAASDREDPVLSADDLHRFLDGLFAQLHQLLTLAQIDTALKRRFSFAYPSSALDLEQAPEAWSTDLQPGEELRISQTAREILAEMTSRQLTILRDRVGERLTLEQLAERHNISRGTADNELRRIDALARTHTLDDNRFDEILEMVVAFASHEEGKQ